MQESDFLERVWAKGGLDGKQYSIALDSHPFIMMYNLDVAEQAGVLGPDGQLAPIDSPDQFLEVARAMQARDRQARAVLRVPRRRRPDVAAVLHALQAARRRLRPVRPAAEVDQDAAVASLEFIQQLLDGTICTPSGDYGTAVSEFMSGESGMFFTGVWELPTAKGSGLDVRRPADPDAVRHAGGLRRLARVHAPAPVEPGPGAAARERTSSSRTCSRTRSAWAEAGHIPAFQPVVQSAEYQALVPQAHYAPAAEILNYDPEAWFTGSGSDFQNYFLETVQSVYLDGADPAEGFNAFVRRVNVQLAKPNPV